MQSRFAQRVAERVAKVPRPQVISGKYVANRTEQLLASPSADPARAIKLGERSRTKPTPIVGRLADRSTVHLMPLYQPRASNSSTNDSVKKLPPLSHKHISHRGPQDKPYEKLSLVQLGMLRELRLTDPDTWTVRKLAKKFNVLPLFVSIAVRCPEARLGQLQDAEEKRVAGLSDKVKEHISIRQQRRAQW
ncbi:hypothetical protein RI367_004349 [Sorochytrium milnesiophthora]